MIVATIIENKSPTDFIRLSLCDYFMYMSIAFIVPCYVIYRIKSGIKTPENKNQIKSNKQQKDE